MTPECITLNSHTCVLECIISSEFLEHLYTETIKQLCNRKTEYCHDGLFLFHREEVKPAAWKEGKQSFGCVSQRGVWTPGSSSTWISVNSPNKNLLSLHHLSRWFQLQTPDPGVSLSLNNKKALCPKQRCVTSPAETSNRQSEPLWCCDTSDQHKVFCLHALN